jgi:hypothetical protein
VFDPLLTLLAAKAKSVGLVAGTAMVTTALVGGGAVAMTAVNSSNELTDETAVVETVESPSPDAGALEVSATPTVGIDPDAPEPDVTTDVDGDGLADETGLPVGFVCDDSKNHGQNVSSFASTHKGPGHGQLVSAIAQSDCGKSGDEAEAEEEAEEEAELETAEADDAAEAEQRAEQKAEKKAEKKAAQAERKAEKKAAASERKGGGKGNGGGKGKGNGKGGGRG